MMNILGVILVTRLVFVIRRDDLSIRIRLHLGDQVDDIHAETRSTSVEPELKDVMHSFADLWVLPVEIGLLGSEKGKVVLSCLLIPSPRRVLFSENHGPIVWWLAVTIFVVLCGLPDVPVTLWVVFR